LGRGARRKARRRVVRSKRFATPRISLLGETNTRIGFAVGCASLHLRATVVQTSLLIDRCADEAQRTLLHIPYKIAMPIYPIAEQRMRLTGMLRADPNPRRPMITWRSHDNRRH
jgi:hypothetical protein